MAAPLKTFSIRLPGQIWQAIPAIDDRWVLEWRDPEHKTVNFTVLQPTSDGRASILAEVNQQETDWWMTLAGAGSHAFWIHTYRNPDIPEPSDLIGFSLNSGSNWWSIPNSHFVGWADNRPLIATKSVPPTVYQMDELTGLKFADFSGNELTFQPRWTVAQSYKKNDPYYTNLVQFIEKYLKLTPSGTIEYLDYADRMAFSFYLYDNGRLTQYVTIVNRFKEIEYQEVIEQNLGKEGQNTLLEKDGWLFFIKQKNNFIGINLAV